VLHHWLDDRKGIQSAKSLPLITVVFFGITEGGTCSGTGCPKFTWKTFDETRDGVVILIVMNSDVIFQHFVCMCSYVLSYCSILELQTASIVILTT